MLKALSLPRPQRDERGATVIEIAILAPVVLLFTMGLGDLLYQEYAQSLLSGAVQQAVLDSRASDASTAMIDTKVETLVSTIAGHATFISIRRGYGSVSEPLPEPMGAGCSASVRHGGAGATAVYTMTMTYPRLFPVATLFGWPSNQTISASSPLKNQPTTRSVSETTPTCP